MKIHGDEHIDSNEGALGSTRQILKGIKVKNERRESASIQKIKLNRVFEFCNCLSFPGMIFSC